MLIWPQPENPLPPAPPQLATIQAKPGATPGIAVAFASSASRPSPLERRRVAAQAPMLPAPPAAPPTGRPARPAAVAPEAPPYLAMLMPAGGGGAGLVPPAPLVRHRPPPLDRLSGYGWAFARSPNGGSGLAESGQLGGSQAGMRLDYAIGPDPARGLRIGARVSAPLAGRGREAAIGIGWKAGPELPVTLTLERRIGLDRAGRDAFALGVAGGVGAIPLPADFRLDAYGQAGIVGLKRRDGYVDGAASALRPVLTGKTVSIAAGAGLWGAAQPGVSRLDVGPRLRATISVAGASIGAAIDWRQRIAGQASPRSGIAVTLDGSF